MVSTQLEIVITNCLSPEDFVTVQIGYTTEDKVFLKTLQGDEEGKSKGINKVQKQSKMVHTFSSDKEGVFKPIHTLLVWQKADRYVEFRIQQPKSTSTELIRNTYYILQDGVHFLVGQESGGDVIREICTDSDTFLWRKIQHLEEIRGASGKVMRLECMGTENS